MPSPSSSLAPSGTFPACGWLRQREVLVYSLPLAALLVIYLGFSIFTLRPSPRRPRGEGSSHIYHEVWQLALSEGLVLNRDVSV
jgi:hypothetical protein